jgi:pimeloyl-ACP methyl ester carboxylesterase
MSGRIALELALSCPARLGRLVLVSASAAGRGKVTMSWPMRLLLPLTWAGLLRSSHPQPRYAHLRQRQASVTYDATNRLGQIRVPTLILHGRRDKSMPLELAERMHVGISRHADGGVPRRPHLLPTLRAPAVPRPSRPLPCRVTTEPAATQIPTQFWRDWR